MGRWVKNNLIPFLQNIGKPISVVFDFLIFPLVLISALVLKFYRKVGSKRFPLNTRLLKYIGVFPIIDHFYEPFFNHKNLSKDLSRKRNLPALNFRENDQLNLLKKFTFQKEFEEFLNSEKKSGKLRSFSIQNGSYGAGDAEFLFNFLRLKKPKRVIEVGSGNSSKVIEAALKNNLKEGFQSKLTCIEPYKPWLKETEIIEIHRTKIEETSYEWDKVLSEGDFLFIDSSHMIRPQGDVLFEYLEMIPKLNPGVIVHIHDIFSPREYPKAWLKFDVKFWNEQYLLETLLSNKDKYKIIASLNYLKNDFFPQVKGVCPYLEEKHEPAAFYFEVI